MMSSIFLMSHDLSQPIRTGSEAQKQMLQLKKVLGVIIHLTISTKERKSSIKMLRYLQFYESYPIEKLSRILEMFKQKGGSSNKESCYMPNARQRQAYTFSQEEWETKRTKNK